MDAKMKGIVVTVLMGLCMLLGLMAQFGSTWLTDDSEEDMLVTSGLHNMHITYEGDRAKAMEAAGMTCENMVKAEEAAGNESMSCDGDTMVINYATKNDECSKLLSDGREAMSGAGMTDEQIDAALKDSQKDCDDVGAMADSGSTGGMVLWIASVAAIVGTLLLVLNMAGVEIDAIPDKVGMITMWAAGGLTLLAVLLWYMMLPDTDSESVLGMSGYMACIAAVMGLAAGGMETFMAADDDAPAE